MKQRKAKTKHVDHYNVPLSVQELNEAEITIIQFVQSKVFSKALDILHRANSDGEPDSRGWEKQKKVEFKKFGSLYRLDPFVREGVLCVGGRLSQADLSEEAKHPVILPCKNHVTTLIIRQTNEHLGHAGRGHTLAKLREKYGYLAPMLLSAIKLRNVLPVVETVLP